MQSDRLLSQMLKRAFKISIGVVFIIVGIAGLFLPVLPGILPIFIGVAFIMDKNPKLLFKDIVTRAKERYNKKKCV